MLEKLAQGGMGVIYKVQDPALNRILALKVMAPGAMPDSDEEMVRQITDRIRIRDYELSPERTAGSFRGLPEGISRILYRCPQCAQLLQALEMRAGKTTVCSKCSRPLTTSVSFVNWDRGSRRPAISRRPM